MSEVNPIEIEDQLSAGNKIYLTPKEKESLDDAIIHQKNITLYGMYGNKHVLITGRPSRFLENTGTLKTEEGELEVHLGFVTFKGLILIANKPHGDKNPLFYTAKSNVLTVRAHGIYDRKPKVSGH